MCFSLESFFNVYFILGWAFPGGAVVKNLPANAGSPREGNGNPLNYSSLGNPMDREAWWATVHRVAKKSDMT